MLLSLPLWKKVPQEGHLVTDVSEETRKVNNDSEAYHNIFKELQKKLDEYLNNA